MKNSRIKHIVGVLTALFYAASLSAQTSVLEWATFIHGTTSNESIATLDVDGTGNVYVAGLAVATDFPVTAGAYQTTSNGGQEGFVSKLSPDGSTLLISTYFGGSGNENVETIVVLPSGLVVITGTTTSSDLPVSVGAYQPSLNGTADAFIATLNATLTSVLYCSYLGGSLSENGFDVDVQSDGDVVIGGRTNSTDFPTTVGAYQPAMGGGTQDGFVAILSTDLTTLKYATYLGGNDYEYVNDLHVDAADEIYVCGDSRSTDYPTTAGAYQTTNSGFADICLSKFDSAGTTMIYSTFIGGTAFESGYSLFVNSNNEPIVGGSSFSNNYPVTVNAAQSSRFNSGDAVVSKLSNDGTTLLYSTYLGGTGLDDTYSIEEDAGGFIYFTGRASNNDFPTTAGAFQTVNGGGEDFFLSIIQPSGSLAYSTFVGGNQGDDAHLRGVALELRSGSMYLAGTSQSSDMHTSVGAYQATKINPAGDYAAWAGSFSSPIVETNCSNSIDDDGDGAIDCADSDCIPDTPGTITPGSTVICENETGITYSISPVAGATSYQWSVPAGATIVSGQGTTSISVDWGTSNGAVCVYATNGSCNSANTCYSVVLVNVPLKPTGIQH